MCDLWVNWETVWLADDSMRAWIRIMKVRHWPSNSQSMYKDSCVPSLCLQVNFMWEKYELGEIATLAVFHASTAVCWSPCFFGMLQDRLFGPTYTAEHFRRVKISWSNKYTRNCSPKLWLCNLFLNIYRSSWKPYRVVFAVWNRI